MSKRLIALAVALCLAWTAAGRGAALAGTTDDSSGAGPATVSTASAGERTGEDEISEREAIAAIVSSLPVAPGTGPYAVEVAARAVSGAAAPEAAAGRRAAVRRRQRRGAVGARPGGRAADREPDEDADRADRRRAPPTARAGAGQRQGARRRGIADRRAEARHARCRSEASCSGCCWRRATTPRWRWPSTTPARVRAFVKRMNRRAAELQLRCSHFAGPAGLQDTGNSSCAYDLAALARADLGNDWIASITRRRSAEVPFPIKGGMLSLANNHYFARNGIAGVPRRRGDRTEDRAHQRRRALLRDHGSPRRSPPRGRPARLARPAAAGAATPTGRVRGSAGLSAVNMLAP